MEACTCLASYEIAFTLCKATIFYFGQKTQRLVTVADPEIFPRGRTDDSQNLRPTAAAIFFLTSFNRGDGPLGPWIRY